MDSPRVRRIVCFGDSITEGAEFAPAQRWTTLLQQRLDGWEPQAWQVHRKGVGGHTSAQGLLRFPTEVQPLLPAVVLVEFGFNDANVYDWTPSPRVALTDYVANLREMHRRIIDGGGDCIFVINHSIGTIDGRQGNGQSYNANFAPYETALRALIAELGTPFVDLPAGMRNARVELPQCLADDGIHLSAEGNHVYASLVFEALQGILPVLPARLQKAI